MEELNQTNYYDRIPTLDLRSEGAQEQIRMLDLQETGQSGYSEDLTEAPEVRFGLRSRWAAAGAATLTLAGVGIASERISVANAEARPMAPKAVLHKIRKIESDNWNPLIHIIHRLANYAVDVKKAKMVSGTIELQGRCDPEKLDRFYIEGQVDTQEDASIKYCRGGTRVIEANDRGGRSLYQPKQFDRKQRQLGRKVARSAKIDDSQHGDADKIVATNRWARIRYEYDEDSAVKRQVHYLTLRKGHKPKKKLYKKPPIQQDES